MKSEIDKKKSFYRNDKDYMNSYHWNYITLELVDYIETKLKSVTDTTTKDGSKDDWRYFKEFCKDRGLNWRVIRKMMEFAVGQAFNSEEDMTKHEAFRSLKNDDCKECKIPMENLNYNFDCLDNI